MNIKDAVKAVNEILDKESKIKIFGVSNKNLQKALEKTLHTLKKDKKAYKKVPKEVKEFAKSMKASGKDEKSSKKDSSKKGGDKKGGKKDKKDKKDKKKGEKKARSAGVVRVAVETYLKDPDKATAETVNAAVEKKLGKQAKSTVSNVMCVMGHVKEVLGLGKKEE